MPILEAFCPYCEAVAESRGKTRSVAAPPDWFRCPECFCATPFHYLPRRKRVSVMSGVDVGSKGLRMLEILRGTTHPETGDQNLSTYFSQTLPIDGSGGFPDIGTSLTDLATTPASIDHILIRVYADTDDPGLSPFYFNISWHPTGEGDGLVTYSANAEPGTILFPSGNMYEITASLTPNGNPWSKAILNTMDISVYTSWDTPNPFSGDLTLRVFEHEVEIWGTT
jgi:hypothetical protein